LVDVDQPIHHEARNQGLNALETSHTPLPHCWQEAFMGFLERFVDSADAAVKLFADSTTRDQPALGEYGWVWVSIVGIGQWVLHIRLQRQPEKLEAQRDYERLWGQRENETVEEWRARTVQLRQDID
jgi:hypothetical protein